MDKKKKKLLGSAVIGFVVLYLAYTSFATSITQYKTIEEILTDVNSNSDNLTNAESTYGKYIHVAGKVANGTSTWVPETRTLTFTMEDNNYTIDVKYVGDKPGNFQEGVDVDVAGIYTEEKVFLADKLLFKCPSKYEEGLDEQI